MKVDSHIVTGGLVGALVTARYPGLNIVQAFGYESWQFLDTLITGVILTVVSIFAATVADAPLVAQVKVDDRKKRPRFSAELDPNFEDSVWYSLKSMSHSFLWWLIALITSWQVHHPVWSPILTAVFVGLASHWFIDLFTHCHPQFKRTDQDMIWPFGDLFQLFGKDIPKLSHIVKKVTGIGIEYRQNITPGLDPYANTEPMVWETAFQVTGSILWGCLVLLILA
ncbi:hypothetical protein KW782_03580 [Candidatus Parcubacteria bacterium]|nr:hypothetical protein [Candidatus Parcubacteria bacterium]